MGTRTVVIILVMFGYKRDKQLKRYRIKIKRKLNNHLIKIRGGLEPKIYWTTERNPRIQINFVAKDG